MCWIKGCLISIKGSILVNGSPTSEFDVHRGLHQGDPLTPFIFTLVVDGGNGEGGRSDGDGNGRGGGCGDGGGLKYLDGGGDINGG